MVQYEIITITKGGGGTPTVLEVVGDAPYMDRYTVSKGRFASREKAQEYINKYRNEFAPDRDVSVGIRTYDPNRNYTPAYTESGTYLGEGVEYYAPPPSERGRELQRQREERELAIQAAEKIDKDIPLSSAEKLAYARQSRHIERVPQTYNPLELEKEKAFQREVRYLQTRQKQKQIPTQREEFMQYLFRKQGYSTSVEDDYLTVSLPQSSRKEVIDLQTEIIANIPKSAVYTRGYENKLSPIKMVADITPTATTPQEERVYRLMDWEASAEKRGTRARKSLGLDFLNYTGNESYATKLGKGFGNALYYISGLGYAELGERVAIAGGKIAAQWEGLFKSPRSTIRETGRAAKETLSVYDIRTPEGIVTWSLALLPSVKAFSSAKTVKAKPSKLRVTVAKGRGVDIIDMIIKDATKPIPSPRVKGKPEVIPAIIRERNIPGIERPLGTKAITGAIDKGLYTIKDVVGADFKGIQNIPGSTPDIVFKKGNIEFAQLGIEEAGILKPYELKATTRKGKILYSNQALNILTREQPSTIKGMQYYGTIRKEIGFRAPEKIIAPNLEINIMSGIQTKPFITSDYVIFEPKPSLAVAQSVGKSTQSYITIGPGNIQYATTFIGKDYFAWTKTLPTGEGVFKLFRNDELVFARRYKSKPLLKATEPITQFKTNQFISMPNFRMDSNFLIQTSKGISLQKGKYEAYGIRATSYAQLLKTEAKTPYTEIFAKPIFDFETGNIGLDIKFIRTKPTRFHYVDYWPKQKALITSISEAGIYRRYPTRAKTYEYAKVSEPFEIKFFKRSKRKEKINIKVPATQEYTPINQEAINRIMQLSKEQLELKGRKPFVADTGRPQKTKLKSKQKQTTTMKIARRQMAMPKGYDVFPAYEIVRSYNYPIISLMPSQSKNLINLRELSRQNIMQRQFLFERVTPKARIRTELQQRPFIENAMMQTNIVMQRTRQRARQRQRTRQKQLQIQETTFGKFGRNSYTSIFTRGPTGFFIPLPRSTKSGLTRGKTDLDFGYFYREFKLKDIMALPKSKSPYRKKKKIFL